MCECMNKTRRLCTKQWPNMSSHIYKTALHTLSVVQTVNSWLNFLFEINGLHFWIGSFADLLTTIAMAYIIEIMCAPQDTKRI